MRNRGRRLTVSILSLGVALFALHLPGQAAPMLCEQGCTTSCPDDIGQLCKEHCMADQWTCGQGSWCEPDMVAYHCFSEPE